MGILRAGLAGAHGFAVMVSSNVQHQKSERDEVANANGGKYSNELHLYVSLPGSAPVFIGTPVSLSPLSFDTFSGHGFLRMLNALWRRIAALRFH
jgi:hypothetical protein